MTDKIAEIRERHARDAEWSGGWAQICPRTHADRATLLAEVERLRKANEAACGGDELLRAAFTRLLDRLTRERDDARAEVEKLRAALIEWDALIKHQFSGTRDAMSDMQRAALHTKRILDELDAREALEAKP